MSEHSKLPGRMTLPLRMASLFGAGRWEILDAKDIHIGEVHMISSACPSREVSQEEAKAHAEFIILACNSQPALLAVCEKIKKAGDDTIEDCHEFLSRFDDLWDELEAALTAAAEGKQESRMATKYHFWSCDECMTIRENAGE